jgi:hypothetical protein
MSSSPIRPVFEIDQLKIIIELKAKPTFLKSVPLLSSSELGVLRLRFAFALSLMLKNFFVKFLVAIA